MKDQPHGDRGLSRRDFLRGGMAVGLGTAALGAAAEAAQDENAEGATESGRARRIRGKTEVVLRVDGQDLFWWGVRTVEAISRLEEAVGHRPTA